MDGYYDLHHDPDYTKTAISIQKHKQLDLKLMRLINLIALLFFILNPFDSTPTAVAGSPAFTVSQYNYGSTANSVMNVLTPSGTLNDAVILDIISGFWQSSLPASINVINSGEYSGFFSRGYRVVQIIHDSAPQVPGGPGLLVQQIITQLQGALQYYNNILVPTLGLIPNKYCLRGRSSGGHLAMMLHATNPVPAAVAFAPPTNFANWGAVPGLPAGGNFVETYWPLFFTTQPTTNQANTMALSLAPVLTSSTNPFLFIHGTADDVVPAAQSDVYCNNAYNLGVNVAYIQIDGIGHAPPQTFINGWVAEKQADWSDSIIFGSTYSSNYGVSSPAGTQITLSNDAPLAGERYFEIKISNAPIGSTGFLLLGTNMSSTGFQIQGMTIYIALTDPTSFPFLIIPLSSPITSPNQLFNIPIPQNTEGFTAFIQLVFLDTSWYSSNVINFTIR
ncbi:MAG: prolyl oligopeptidase family serine peptidase [Planctomycetes bacterium]|nr:prolyl oligopeptidase family serine peptidase [Planctomycetota bacterium]